VVLGERPLFGGGELQRGYVADEKLRLPVLSVPCRRKGKQKGLRDVIVDHISMFLHAKNASKNAIYLRVGASKRPTDNENRFRRPQV